MVSIPPITLRDVYHARARIKDLARRTPLVASPSLEARVGTRVFLKLENLQATGAFKIRGAANKVLSLSEEERARGVVTVSSGNHGRAVSYVANELGAQAVVCVTHRVSEHKMEAIRKLGAELVLGGDNQDEAEAHARGLVAERRLTFIDPFDDPHVIAGQGTIGLELLEENPEVDTVVVPLSGGGLISGIALALKSVDPRIRVIGVSMERAPAMYLSLQAGRPVTIVEEETLADALIGGIGLENHYTFQMCQQYVDDVVLVSEEAIGRAMAFALREHHLVVEGGAAVAIAAVLGQKTQLGRNVAVVVSGGNVDVPLLLEVTRRSVQSGFPSSQGP